jgi:hypothetical protein
MNGINHLFFTAGFLFTLCAAPKDLHAGNIYLSNYENSALGVSNALNAATNYANCLWIDADRDLGAGLTGKWSGVVIRGVGTNKISGKLVFHGGDEVAGSGLFTNNIAEWIAPGTNVIALQPRPPIGSKLVLYTTKSYAYKNQCGLEFVRVTEYVEGNTNVVIVDSDFHTAGNQPLKKWFYKPKAYYFLGDQRNLNFTNGATFISGNWTNYFKVGDVVRVENYDGTDNAFGDQMYYENVLITAIDATGITFADTPLNANYGRPILAKCNFGNNIAIRDADIENLTINNYRNITISDLNTEYLRFYNCIAITVSNVVAVNTNQNSPLVVSSTFCKRGFYKNIYASGAYGNTDNGNFKFMSCQNFRIFDCSTGDSWLTDDTGAMPGFFMDFLYSPYASWNNNITISNLTTQLPLDGYPISTWMNGVRNSTFSDIVSEGILRMQYNTNVTVTGDNIIGEGIESFDNKSCNFKFGSAVTLNVIGDCSSVYSGTLSGGSNELYGMNVWVHGGSYDTILSNVYSTSQQADTFIYVHDCNGLNIKGCADTDRTNTAWSVYKNPLATNLIIGVGNSFKERTNY